MHLTKFLPPGSSDPRVGDVRDDKVVMFTDAVSVVDVLVAGAAASADGPTYGLQEVTLLAPYRPRVIFGIGLNYLAHARESGLEPPPEPMVFVKSSSSVVAPNEPVRTHGSPCLDYEAELAVIVGSCNSVAGYAIGNDISARDWQRQDEEWWRGKGADGFCRFGPWVTSADEVPNPEDLLLRCWVNGELRQEARTSDLIFGIEDLIEFISGPVKLEPGDLILTGTPNGVGVSMDPPRYLRPGDVVRIEIERLGVIEHAVVA